MDDERDLLGSMRVINADSCSQIFDIQPDGFVVVSGNCSEIQVVKQCFPTLGETRAKFKLDLFPNQAFDSENEEDSSIATAKMD